MTSPCCPPLSLLLVDDDDELRELFAELLRGDGLYVVEASDGARALQLLRAGLAPDLILSDVTMPVVDGVELARAVGRDPLLAHIPMVLLTAAPPPARAFPVVQVLRKPFDYEELLQRVPRWAACRGVPGWQQAQEPLCTAC